MQGGKDDRSLLSSDPAARRRAVAAILLFGMAAAVAYFTMYLPVHQALVSHGALRYYTKGILLPPELLYLAILVATVNVSDGQIRTFNSKGRRTFTRKGWLVLGGAVVVAGLALAAWTMYLRALGYHSAP